MSVTLRTGVRPRDDVRIFAGRGNWGQWGSTCNRGLRDVRTRLSLGYGYFRGMAYHVSGLCLSQSRFHVVLLITLGFDLAYLRFEMH